MLNRAFYRYQYLIGQGGLHGLCGVRIGFCVHSHSPTVDCVDSPRSTPYRLPSAEHHLQGPLDGHGLAPTGYQIGQLGIGHLLIFTAKS